MGVGDWFTGGLVIGLSLALTLIFLYVIMDCLGKIFIGS